MAADLPANLLPIDEVEGLADSEIANQLRLVQCRAENGWLYLGWNHQPDYVSFSWAVDTPAIWVETVINGLGNTYIESMSPTETIPAGSVILDGPVSNVIQPAVQTEPVVTVEGELKK